MSVLLGQEVVRHNSLLLLAFVILEQDAINSYVFKLAPKKAGADALSERLMWGAPFPVAAYSRNKFYIAVCPNSFSLLDNLVILGRYFNRPMFLKTAFRHTS